MVVNINETITNIYTEDGELIRTAKEETYSIYPEEGKALRNKKTGAVIKGWIVVNAKIKIKDYEEIDIEE